jgi:hypothetical protein
MAALAQNADDFGSVLFGVGHRQPVGSRKLESQKLRASS